METREIVPDDFDCVVKTFGQKIIRFDMLKFEENNFNLGAFDNEKLIGIITAQPRKLMKPLEDQKDLFIAYIAVVKEYRNQGVATKLIQEAEKFAKAKGFFQITGWSDKDTIEMNRLAMKLKYTMCQALMYDENYLPHKLEQCVKGYYYGKRLD